MIFEIRKVLILTIMSLALAGSACLFSPPPGDPPDKSDYHSPVDTPAKLLDNFLLSYQTKNIDAYMDCLHDEFEFELLEVDWDDYTGDGNIDHSWGRDIEENMAGRMFASNRAEVVDLSLEGNTEFPWHGDPDGETILLQRSFKLKVYFIDELGEMDGSEALGSAVFLVKPNEDGDYQIWRWTDLSQT